MIVYEDRSTRVLRWLLFKPFMELKEIATRALVLSRMRLTYGSVEDTTEIHCITSTTK